MQKIEEEFICLCDKIFSLNNEPEIQNHISNCKLWQDNSPLFKIMNRINLFQLSFMQLQAIKHEFSNYLNDIDIALNKKGYQPNFKEPVASETPPPPPLICKNSYELPIPPPLLEKPSFEYSLYDFDEKVQCMLCNQKISSFDTNQFWYLQLCCHCICRMCLVKHINNNFYKEKGVLKCPVKTCSDNIINVDFEAIIGKERMEIMNVKLFEIDFNIASCVKCKEKFEFQKGKEDPNTKDDKGRKLTKEQLKNYVENRFTCLNPKCKTEQCKSCGVTPYHLGFTCEEWFKNMKAIKCRYCESVIANLDLTKVKALQAVCKEDECKKKAENACAKVHPCGHPCSGILGEINCLPCLEDSCAEKQTAYLMDQKGSDYCRVCYIEGLANAPSIRAKCGHIFHFSCLKKRLELRWTRPRITFTFCLCPLCKAWMEFPIESYLTEIMNSFQVKYEDIKKKSMGRLKHEEREKDERLTRPSDPFYNKPVEYAIAIYSYYECFKCKVPFFGGLKKCEDLLEEEKKTDEFKPQELVCANCCDIPIENCKKHGADFIEFKCKFCCTIANWFCWGNTHFCEPCHQKAMEVSKQPKNKLPKCPGPAKCPLKVKHKDNGEECALGCALCRNFKENYKEF